MYEDMPVEEIPFEDMPVEELDELIESSTNELMLDKLTDVLEIMQYGFVLDMVMFALIFFILVFVAIGVGKK